MQQRFDAALLLHEDWEADGFYLYELVSNSDCSLAETVIEAVSRVSPILQANWADDWPARNGVVRPNVNHEKRPDWPEALFLIQEKTDLCYTFEASSDYDLPIRVSALVTAVNTVIQQILCESDAE